MNLIWHYDKIYAYNQRKYTNILTAADITGDMIARKVGDEVRYYYPFKKGVDNYLVETTEVQDVISLLPIKIIASQRTPYRGKGYLVVESCKPVEVRPERTMSYKQFIDAFMNFEHKAPDELRVWKLIVDAAYVERINIRAVSYPGWLKDSTLTLLGLLRGDVSIVNKPSHAKLKYLICAKNKVIGLNEVQQVEAPDRRDLAKFYEDTGDFKPEYISDKRSMQGTAERADINNLSTMTFSNFPRDEDELIFDQIFQPKILSRIFPIMLSGGSNDPNDSACLEKFGHVQRSVTDEEYAQLDNFLRNHRYYELNFQKELDAKPNVRDAELQTKFANPRWNRNWQTICTRLKLYAESVDEFRQLELQLYVMHKNYIQFVTTRVATNSGKLTVETL